MANFEDVKDDDLRQMLATAHGHLRAKRPTDAVRALADAFVAMLERNPELRTAEEELGALGRKVPLVWRWPMLGARIVPGSVEEGRPRIELTRERFSISEAFTYYEFTVETAIRYGV